MEPAVPGAAPRRPYQHLMSAHCESGVTTSLLRHAGLDLQEPDVFGIGSGIFFAYLETAFLPFPMVACRTQPGAIWKKVGQRLGVPIRSATWRNPLAAEAGLDALLDRGIPTAVQVDFFYMPWIPEYARVHFNAHYVVAVGRTADGYRVADPYAPEPGLLPVDVMRVARSAQGQFAPRGQVFWVEPDPSGRPVEVTRDRLARATREGIRQAASWMIRIPIPFLGVRAIRRFARQIPRWPSLCRDEDHLVHEVQKIMALLEEQGTGGAGFRFLYATSLQRAARILESAEIEGLSREMMANGDRWREISLLAGRMGRNRDLGAERLAHLSGLVMARADEEERLFRRLLEVTR